MKNVISRTLLASVFSAAVCCSAIGQDAPAIDEVNDHDELRVMSFNIRYGLANDGDDSWPKRDTFVADVIKDFDPDLLGIQEAMGFQAEFLKQQLPDWKYFGASRDPNPNGEQCGIFVKTQRFQIVEDGQFWLSETPDEKFSKSWDSSLPRIATWVRLRNRKTNRTILYLNTHFDHRGAEARFQAARIIREFLARQPDTESLVVTGDFNCGYQSKPYTELLQAKRLKDTWREVTNEHPGKEGTFNGFKGTDNGDRIDWVLCSKELKVVDAQIVKTSREGKYPSDHFPVTAVLK